MFTTKKQVVDFYKEKLRTNKAWVIKGLSVIYNYQLEVEQESKDAKFHNGVGFSALDAEILSSFHEQYEKRKNLSEKQFEWQKEKYEEEQNKPVVKVDSKTGRTTVYDPKTGKASVFNPDGSVAIGADGSGSDYTTNIDHVIEIGVKGKGKDKIIRSAEIDKASEILAGTKTIDYTDLTTEQQEQVDKQIRGDYPDNYTYYVRDASTGFLGLGIVGDRHESVIIVPKKQRRSTGTSSVVYDEDAY
jgi:hypothetical protein